MPSFLKLASLLGLVGAVVAQPVARQVTADAPYSVPLSDITASVVCPRGIQSRAGGVVLLVHGTSITGSDAWSKGPYNVLLPDIDPTFDVCWLETPQNSAVDVQITSEYVAGNVKPLAAKSATGKVSIIAHSQGTINTQWALTFWPSIRPLVADFISLSGDFKGTTAFPFCPSLGCNAALWQQIADSRFLNALSVYGADALVDTTAIVSANDEVVKPQTGPNASGWLGGASSNFRLQDSNVCGFTHFALHADLLIDQAAFGLAYTALTTPGPAKSSNLRDCTIYAKTSLTKSASVYGAAYVPALMAQARSLLTNAVGDKVPAEPFLKPYVCAAGAAQASECSAA